MPAWAVSVRPASGAAGAVAGPILRAPFLRWARQTTREALARFTSDPELAGSDALTTAKVLAAAAQKLGEADLILAATESSDGYTGTVPPYCGINGIACAAIRALSRLPLLNSCNCLTRYFS